jgi:hypothetical protein
MINQGHWCLNRRRLFTVLVGLGAGAVIGCTKVMAAVEQNALKRRRVGLVACDPDRASLGLLCLPLILWKTERCI